MTTFGLGQTYVQLPLCLDQQGHRFEIDYVHRDRSVCRRCGFIRCMESASTTNREKP